jgi:hypothetical protein
MLCQKKKLRQVQLLLTIKKLLEWIHKDSQNLTIASLPSGLFKKSLYRILAQVEEGHILSILLAIVHVHFLVNKVKKTSSILIKLKNLIKIKKNN